MESKKPAIDMTFRNLTKSEYFKQRELLMTYYDHMILSARGDIKSFEQFVTNNQRKYVPFL
jgi:hypothetical protein